MSTTSVLAATQVMLGLLAQAQTVGNLLARAQAEGNRPLTAEEWAVVTQADAAARAGLDAAIQQAQTEGR